MKTLAFVNISAFEAIELAEKNKLEMEQDWNNETTIIFCDDGQVFVSGNNVNIVNE